MAQFRASFQIFTGQVPFAEYKASAMVMKNIIDGERPQRPLKGKRLGLSDEFWEITQSSWAHDMKERPPVETFIKFLEKATPDMAALKELTEFDTNSEGDIQKLRNLFEYGDNALFGMREDEILVAIEIFDRVGFLVWHFAALHRFLSTFVPGPELFAERLQAPQSMSAWASEGVRPMWPSAEKLLDLPRQPRQT